MLRIALAVILAAHGIGHSIGLLQAIRVTTVNTSFHGDSWLMTPAIGSTATQVVGAVLWSVALAGFVALAGVVLGWLPASLWQPLAVGSAVVSLVGVVLFPTAFPAGSTVGAVAVDIVLLVAVLWAGWAPSELSA